MMTHRALNVGLAAFSLIALAGCNPFSAASRGVKEFKGASGKIVVIKAAPPSFYESVSSVQIGSVTNSISPVCDAETFGEIEQALTQEAEEVSQDLEGSGGPCKVDVDVQFYQGPGRLSALFGKQALLIGRARVADEASQPAADVLVVVTSKAMRTGGSALAEGFAKTLIDYCREGDSDD